MQLEVDAPVPVATTLTAWMPTPRLSENAPSNVQAAWVPVPEQDPASLAFTGPEHVPGAVGMVAGAPGAPTQLATT